MSLYEILLFLILKKKYFLQKKKLKKNLQKPTSLIPTSIINHLNFLALSTFKLEKNINKIFKFKKKKKKKQYKARFFFKNSFMKNRYLNKKKKFNIFFKQRINYLPVASVPENFINFKYYTFFHNTEYLQHSSNSGFVFLLFQEQFQLYLNSITNYFFKLHCFNTISLLDYSEVQTYSTVLKKITPRKFKFLYFEELAELFLSTFLTKNISFLTLWMKKNIESRPIKMFKAFVYFVYKVIKKFFWKNLVQFQIKGIYIRFSGKFLKGGGKKKKIIFRKGSFSSTKKTLKIIYKIFYIRTISGIIGCTFKLAY